MYNDILIASFKFINLDNDSYAKEALKAQNTENYLWWNNIKVIANSLKINPTNIPNTNLLTNLLRSEYEMQWKRYLDNDGKLDTYTKFKNDILYEPYLDERTNVIEKTLLD